MNALARQLLDQLADIRQKVTVDYPAEQRALLIRLRELGVPKAQIAARLGISPTAVGKWYRAIGDE